MNLVPPLEPRCGSWICTSPAGEVREFFERENVARAAIGGWLVETVAQYLGRINGEIRSRS